MAFSGVKSDRSRLVRGGRVAVFLPDGVGGSIIGGRDCVLMLDGEMKQNEVGVASEAAPPIADGDGALWMVCLGVVFDAIIFRLFARAS